MKTPLVAAAIIALSVSPLVAFAHGDENRDVNSYSFGTPAEEANATRTINIEASDDKFAPSEITVKQGETIRFVVTNTGKHVHDFNIGDMTSQQEHAQMMAKMPDMHDDDDPTARTIKRGEVARIAWTFNKIPADPIEIDCLVPGHYEKGMMIKVNLIP
jgi:uncharacterized cupredoxin-like copper-binding protein